MRDDERTPTTTSPATPHVEIRVLARDSRESPTAQRAQGRDCGTCRACCTVFDVPDVDKPRNVLCPHADRTGSDLGCTIYTDRPDVCRAFECAWKQGLAGENDRPDKLGVLFYLIPLNDRRPGLGVVETTPGAFERKPVQQLLRLFNGRKPGRIMVRRAAENRFIGASMLIEGRPLAKTGERVSS
ncbi:MAG: hypothetical protein H6810_11840 [Phycisphaeraceae bacterium]|nr:MAG: hypothetical protein H6810_11840 [Phycisphaeraceae bacterium]